jgi:hypothetical protein
MTDDMKQKAQNEFSTLLENLKMSDGKLNYNVTFNYDKCNATVLITPEAYRKIVALVTEFSDEVAWHGTVTRSLSLINEFTIEDIFVYPQEVTGGTVTTDQDEYSKWLYELDDEVFPKIRMQGHSHVNMGVSPSGVDDNHRKQILEQLDSEMFYIFMIWNKSLSIHTLIYDMANNVLYENNDVEVKLLMSDGVDDFLVDAKEKVQKRSAVKKSKKSPKNLKHQERLEQIQLQEFYDEFGTYPFSRHDYRDPFYSAMEGSLCRH